MSDMKQMANNRYILLLIALCLVSYARTFDVPFILDDFAYIENNPLIRSLSNFFNKRRTFETFASHPGMLEDTLNSFIARPMSYLTFSFNYYIHGVKITGYHLVNILIHTLNSILVYLLVRTSIYLLCNKYDQSTPSATSLDAQKTAFLTASLFAVHPLMTNSVTYIIQRMTSLVALFYLASILLYAYYYCCRNTPRKKVFYCLSVISCGTAMLTKESAFTLPAMLTLYDLFFCQRTRIKRIISMLPFFLTMVIIPLNVLGLQNSETSQSQNKLISSLNSINFMKVTSWEYLLTQFRAVAFYIKLLLMPFGLSLQHDFRVSHSLTDADVLLSLLLHAAFIGYGIYLIRTIKRGSKSHIVNTLSAFGIFWFYIALLVESSVIPLNEMAVEYRTYLPSIGLFLFGVCIITKLFNKLNVTATEYVVWIPVICLLMYLTMSRNEVWRKPDEFWKQTISLYPKLARPYANLADYYINRGAFMEAARVYETSIQEIPNEAELHYELGNVFILAKDYESAIYELTQAMFIKPEYIKTYESMARAYVFTGRYEQAQEILNTAEQFRQKKQP